MSFIDRFLITHPRLLNQLHRLGLAKPHTQTYESELRALSRHATGAGLAVEIGTYQGVSAARIAPSLREDGILYCVDPWREINQRTNPCWLITQRHLRRTGALERIKILRGRSEDVQQMIPNGLDFAFIDGDHSWDGISKDWAIIAGRMAVNGIVCLHDTVTPPDEPWRTLESVRFFQEVILKDTRFQMVETVQSLAVIKKVAE